MKSWPKKLGIAAAAVLLLLCVFSYLMSWAGERMIATGPNGPETPASLGLAYERLKIPSGERLLDAYFVRVLPQCPPRAARLIFHGVGETISEWVGVQRLLYDHCISSMVFDYSGDGDSTGRGSVDHLDEDAVAAFAHFASRFGPEARLCTLGFSMGNAPMLESVDKFHPSPACVVVGSAFSSGRESAAYHWRIPRLLMRLLPDSWDNVENVAHVRAPLLVVHSEADRVNPVWMGERIYQAAREPKRLAVVRGLSHNAAHKYPDARWWGPVIEFVTTLR